MKGKRIKELKSKERVKGSIKASRMGKLYPKPKAKNSWLGRIIEMQIRDLASAPPKRPNLKKT